MSILRRLKTPNLKRGFIAGMTYKTAVFYLIATVITAVFLIGFLIGFLVG